jgi:hypothetical protein
MFGVEENVAYREALNCTNVAEIKEIGKYLFESRCKWRERVSKTQPVLQMTGVRNVTSRNVCREKRKCQAIVLVLV